MSAVTGLEGEFKQGHSMLLSKLSRRYGISLVGEGGEYETFVLDAPFFKRSIRIVEVEKVWKGLFRCLVL